ncbi:Lmo0850 family protein [Staphylococcus aureus]
MKRPEKIQNVVKLLSSLGVNIKKTKSRLDIINTLPATTPVRQELK